MAKATSLSLSQESWRCPHYPHNEGHMELVRGDTWCPRPPSRGHQVLVAGPSPDILGVEFAVTLQLTFPNTPPTTSHPPHFTGLILQWKITLWKFWLASQVRGPGPARGKDTRVWRDGKKTGFRMRRLDSWSQYSHKHRIPILTLTGLILNSSSHFHRRIMIFTWIVVSGNCKCTQEFVSYEPAVSSLV